MDLQKVLGKYIVFPALNIRNQLLPKLRYLEETQWWSLERIQAMQWEKLVSLIKHAESNVPYYKKLFQKIGFSSGDMNSFDDLHVLPLLNKTIIRENFDGMVASGFKRKDLIQRSTSGSTGQPLVVLRDKEADILASAAGYRYRRWAGHDLAHSYARVWARRQHLAKDPAKASIREQLRGTLDQLAEPCITLNAYTMSEELMMDFAKEMELKKIDVLVGYANNIYFFTKFVRRQNMRFKLKCVRTVSEVLFDPQRQLIEDVFGCKVFDTYGNIENGLIAAECDHHSGFHVNAENLYVEILDPSGKPVQGDEWGEIVVTDLNNYGMPLLRYVTGDRGYFSNAMCSCGRGLPLIGKISGRVTDLIVLSDGSFAMWPILSDVLFAFLDDIDRFSVVQHKRGEAKLMVKPTRVISEERIRMIENRLSEVTKGKLVTEVTIVEELPIDPISGKYKYVVSHVKP